MKNKLICKKCLVNFGNMSGSEDLNEVLETKKGICHYCKKKTICYIIFMGCKDCGNIFLQHKLLGARE